MYRNQADKSKLIRDETPLDTRFLKRILFGMVNIIMIAISLVVTGCMVGTLIVFLRRLNRIEEELWGQKKEEAKALVQQEEAAKEEPPSE